MNSLKCILGCAGDKESKALRAKAVKVLGELVQVDPGLLRLERVSACLNAALKARLNCPLKFLMEQIQLKDV
jgi:hypothetical protein